MKTLLSIIVAMALLFAFSMPAMAGGITASGLGAHANHNHNDNLTGISGSAAVANDGSTALRTGSSSAIANNGGTALRTGGGSTIANNGGIAVRNSSNMFNPDNRRFDDDHNAISSSYLLQTNTVTMTEHSKGYARVNDRSKGSIDIKGSGGVNTNFAGIANANLNTGAMNNQGIQNTIAVTVNHARDTGMRH